MSQEQCLYTESHEWIENAGATRRLGITDHAAQMMGDIVFVELPKVGRKVAKGDEIVTIESPKAAASVYAPISGEIVEVNTALEGEPALINQEPFDGGWIVKIRPSNESEQSSLKDHSAYKRMLDEL